MYISCFKKHLKLTQELQINDLQNYAFKFKQYTYTYFATPQCKTMYQNKALDGIIIYS